MTNALNTIAPWKAPRPEPDILPVTQEMIAEYYRWFVNNPHAFCRQYEMTNSEGKSEVSWSRVKHWEIWQWAKTEAKRQRDLSASLRTAPADYKDATAIYLERTKQLRMPDYQGLKFSDIQRHLSGHHTINLFAINPGDQCCKWVAIDADYTGSYAHLAKLQQDLKEQNIEAALEMSRRGGHLWIFCATPLPARQCRLYIYNVALGLGVPIKGMRIEGKSEQEGIEIFPRQDELRDGQIGNAIRGPLGVHRKTMSRYWFENAAPNLQSQFDYLRGVKRLTKEELDAVTLGISMPEAFDSTSENDRGEFPAPRFAWGSDEGPVVTALKAYIVYAHAKLIRSGRRREYRMQCPACARVGNDRSRDNFFVNQSEPWKYRCWAHCDNRAIKDALRDLGFLKDRHDWRGESRPRHFAATTS